MQLFNHDHLGCYADSVFGHNHARGVLAELLRQTASVIHCPSALGLIAKLWDAMSDDAEEEQLALDLLQDSTAPGLAWVFCDGNLLLIDMDDFE